jgi:hypothetical protein
MRQDPSAVVAFNRSQRILYVRAHERPTIVEGFSPYLAGIGNVCQIHVWILFQVLGKVLSHVFESRAALGGEKQELPQPRFSGGSPFGSFLKNDMRIGTPDTQRADAGGSGNAGVLPCGELAIDIERTIVEVDRGIGRLEMQASRYLLVFQS